MINPVEPEKTGQQEDRNSQGRFISGVSGNPAGRPKGSLNRTTLAAQGLLEGEAEQLTRMAIAKALEGDGAALRLCLERLIAPKRDRHFSIPLSGLTDPEHALTIMGEVIEAVKNGDLSPSEGQHMSELLEKWLKMVEVVEFAQRLATIEDQVTKLHSKE